MRFKALTAFCLSAVLTFGLVGCGQTATQPSSQGTAVTTLKLGSLPIEDNLPILVAQKNGYFSEEKLAVELVPFQSPVESQSAFQAGTLDGLVTDMLVAALLKSSGANLKVTSLALGATPTEGRFAILAAPNSKITSVVELKGKAIGISSNSVIEYVTDGLLKAGGLDPSAVEKTVIAKIPLRLEMLLSNQIDAIVVPDPHVSYAVSKGARIIAEDTAGQNLSQSVIVMKASVLTENKDAATRFYKAYKKAVEEINKNPTQYKDLLVTAANIPQEIAKDYKVQHYPLPQLPAETDVSALLKWLDQKALLKAPVVYDDFVQKGLY